MKWQGRIQDFFQGGVSGHNVADKYFRSVGGSYGGGIGGPPPRKFGIWSAPGAILSIPEQTSGTLEIFFQGQCY